MITKMNLSHLPCFGPESSLIKLDRVNFIFGPNGSGKTSISSFLSRPDEETSPYIEADETTTVVVFNRDYISQAFSIDNSSPGVFLLGEDSKDIHEKMMISRMSIQKLKDAQVKINGSIDAVNTEAQQERNRVADLIWKKRSVIPTILLDQLRWARPNSGSKLKCLEEVLRRFNSDDYDPVARFDYEHLANEAAAAFQDHLNVLALVPSAPPFPCDPELILECLRKGHNLGAVWDKLSEDEGSRFFGWLRDGIDHAYSRTPSCSDSADSEANADMLCPFCGQEVPIAVVEKFDQLLANEFEQDRTFLLEQEESWLEYSQALSLFLVENQDVIRTHSGVGQSEIDRIGNELLTFVSSFSRAISAKAADPARREFDIGDERVFEHLDTVIEKANAKIARDNEILRSKRQEQDRIRDATWDAFARYDCADAIMAHSSTMEIFSKKLNGLKSSYYQKDKLLRDEERNLSELNLSLRANNAALETINSMLSACHFNSFYLDASPIISDGFCLRRNDETLAEVSTLSDGERTFISFLYFLYSLKDPQYFGRDLTVVIDDPMSSLDGETMFVMATLIRDLKTSVLEINADGPAQLILLTHNTRFHHEISYVHAGLHPKEVKFFRIRKFSPQPNRVDSTGSKNSIRDAYQELWDEVASAAATPDSTSPWLPNVMRRILETYFDTLGGVGNLYEIGNNLPHAQRVTFHSLVAWSHSGSHTVWDGMDIFSSEAPNSIWVEAFAAAFTGDHVRHYQVMMDRALKFVSISN